MKIHFTGKKISVTKGMEDHFREKLDKLERYASRIIEAHVILKKEKYIFEAEMTVSAKHFKAFGDGRSKENIYTAIDLAYSRVEKQLKKYRSKLKSHKGRSGRKSLVKQEMLDGPPANFESELKERKPTVVMTEDFMGKPVSVEEASLQLEISKDSFLVFLNASTQEVNVLYKRDDGNHGLIQPNLTISK